MKVDGDLFAYASGYATLKKADTNYTLRSTSSTRFLHSMFRAHVPPAGYFPPAIRWIDRANKTFVLERPPTRLTVEFCEHYLGEPCNGSKHFIEVSLPWIVHVIGFQSPRLNSGINRFEIYARPEPIRHMEDRLYRFAFPNLTTSPCLASNYEETYSKWYEYTSMWAVPSQASVVGFVVNAFWASGFNKDISLVESELPEELQDEVEYEEVEYAKEKNVHLLSLLQAYNRRTPVEVTQLSWVDTGVTLQQIRDNEDEQPSKYETSTQLLGSMIANASRNE